MNRFYVLFLGFIAFFCHYARAQEKAVYKDFSDINLEDLTKEGPVGALLMQGHEASNIDSTIYYIKKAKELSLKTKDPSLLPYINYHLGYAYLNNHESDSAVVYLNKCLKLGVEHNLPGMLYESYNLFGVLDVYGRYFNDAINNYELALKYAPTKQDSLYLKINIATVYIDTDKPELAKINLDEVLTYNQEYPEDLDPYWLVYAYINYSMVLKPQQEKLKYINKAVALAEDLDDMECYMASNSKKAEILIDFKAYKEASSIIHNLLKDSKQNELSGFTQRLYFLLASIYSEKKQYQKSFQYLDSINQYNMPNWMPYTVNKIRYSNYEKTNNYKQAYSAALRQIGLLDSLLKTNQDKYYIKYGKKYETDQKIRENALLKKENELQLLTISKEKSIRYLLSVIVLLILVTAVLFYVRYRYKKKTALVLAEKNSLITKQNHELLEANETKQKFFSIIAHDLINPFNALLGYSQLLNEHFNDFDDDEKKQFIKTINKQALQNYNLTKNLLDWSRTQQNKLSLNTEYLELYQLVLQAIMPYSNLAQKKEITTSVLIDEADHAWLDKYIFNIIIVNLYSNAIKYTPKKGNIEIAAHATKTQTILSVKDTGVGMSAAQIENLFSISKPSSSPGTNNETGTGLGLQICKEFVTFHNGSIDVNSTPQVGTNITVRINKF